MKKWGLGFIIGVAGLVGMLLADYLFAWTMGVSVSHVMDFGNIVLAGMIGFVCGYDWNKE